jgi:hypothetical protein
MDVDRPDVLVAIDLGTTFTGVGWARPQFTHVLQSPIQVIHNWPGCSTKNEQKVPTCLVYTADQELSSWGFLCDDDDDDRDLTKARLEFFKIFLDSTTLADARRQGLTRVPSSPAHAARLVSDFLRRIYAHVKHTVEGQTGVGAHPGWSSLKIEFVFSVPTTWRSQAIVNAFKDAIAAAGFGRESPLHSATVELTESEAAAVATLKSSTVAFARGDIFLSVDAGGGTTDFALMRVVDVGVAFPTLAQVSQVDGVGIGAALIDRAFRALVTQRLYAFPEVLRQLPPDCIDKLVRGERFRTIKHKFGETVYSSDAYRIPMEGVGFNFDHGPAGIEGGRMVFSRRVTGDVSNPDAGNADMPLVAQTRDSVLIRPSCRSNAGQDTRAARLGTAEHVWAACGIVTHSLL